MPEMNGHWNEYCAFDKDGSSRGPQFSTAAFRKAFARTAIIARGGPAGKVNAALRKLKLPGVGSIELARTNARIVWNPQGYGSPDIPANSAQAYYPGDAYVDVVANDLYLQATGAAWEANEALYRAHPRKPYAIAEWGLWGIDDPSFVEKMAHVREDPSAHRVPRVLQQQARLALGSRVEASQPRRVPQAHHAARPLTRRLDRHLPVGTRRLAAARIYKGCDVCFKTRFGSRAGAGVLTPAVSRARSGRAR